MCPNIGFVLFSHCLAKPFNLHVPLVKFRHKATGTDGSIKQDANCGLWGESHLCDPPHKPDLHPALNICHATSSAQATWYCSFTLQVHLNPCESLLDIFVCE